MPSGPKRKAQVTSFNSGVGILGQALGVWWGGQAWGEGLKGTEEVQSLVLAGDLGPWYLKPLSQSWLSLFRTLKPHAKAPCPSALSGCPTPSIGASRDEGGPFNHLAQPLLPTPSSLWGNWTPQASMQVLTLLPSVQGGLSEVEAGAAQLGVWGSWA